MSSTNTRKNTVFRHKFSDEMIEEMQEFARIHKYDDRQDFKEAWNTWVEMHESEIAREFDRMEANGFDGDIVDKMYKSVRYYYCKKSNKKTKPKERRVYTKFSKEFLKMMDDHIEMQMREEDTFKPSTGFQDFMKACENDILKAETDNMKELGLKKEDIDWKFKKTYKNRYNTHCAVESS
jgi:hypothetical protein